MTKKLYGVHQVITVGRFMSMQGHMNKWSSRFRTYIWPSRTLPVVIDKCVSHAVGNHILLQRSKSNKTKTFLNKVTALDIAYTICVNKNSKEVWEEDLQIKASSRTDEERHNAMHHKKPKYHVGRGKHLKKFWRWLDRQWTRLLPRFSHDLQGTQVKWCVCVCFWPPVMTRLL